MKHNEDIYRMIDSIYYKAREANTTRELLESINLAKEFPNSIKYNFLWHYLSIFCSLISFMIFLFYKDPVFAILPTDFLLKYSLLFLFLLTPLLFLLGPIFTIYHLLKHLKVTSDYIFQKDSNLDNNLSVVSEYNEIFSTLKNCFFIEFGRGNHKRFFHKGLQYKTKNDDDYDFLLFHFEYIDVRTRNNTPEFEHFHRYGIALDFPFASNIEIKSDGIINFQSSYQPASIKLSEDFNFGAVTDLDLARFLIPSIIIAIEDVSQHFKNLNVEIDGSGILCVTFEDSDVIKSSDKRHFSISDPDNFYNEIKQQTHIEKLEILKNFIDILIRHKDNNFE